MESSNPKYPAPEHVSAEARAFLALPIDMSAAERPAPTSDEEWAAQIAESDGMFGALIRDLIDKAPVAVSRSEIDGVTVREVLPESGTPRWEDRILLNLHGGGYTMFGGDLSVMEAVGPATEGYRVVAVDYRMPPSHPFPAAVDDGVAVLRHLLEKYRPGKVAVYGTSAGGALTASVILAARDQGLPLPAAAVMHTPWADLAKIGDSYETNEGVDPTLPSYEMLRAGANGYAGGEPLDHPLLSPVYGDFGKGFPPSLLSTGTRDLLLSCTVRLHRALRSAGIPAELHVYDAMWHGFPLMVPVEGRDLDRETLEFLDRHLGG